MSKPIDKSYLLTQLKNLDEQVLSNEYLNQENIWEGTSEEYEKAKDTIPNESIILTTDDVIPQDVFIDTELDENSGLPIANKAVTEAINSLTTNSIYSTNETICGTYLGKPLYRRVFNFKSSKTSGTPIAVTTYADHVGQVVKYYGTIVESFLNTKVCLPLMSAYSTSYVVSECCTFINQVQFKITSPSPYFLDTDVELVLEYTKSTD